MTPITSDCPCGGAISVTPGRPGEAPTEREHYDASGQPAPCPLDR
ncbi:hypothetical protein [Streptomyces sp. NPDC001978]